MTDIGIHASHETTQLLACYFRLGPEQVDAMHVAPILRVLHWRWQPLSVYFDPILTR